MSATEPTENKLVKKMFFSERVDFLIQLLLFSLLGYIIFRFITEMIAVIVNSLSYLFGTYSSIAGIDTTYYLFTLAILQIVIIILVVAFIIRLFIVPVYRLLHQQWKI